MKKVVHSSQRSPARWRPTPLFWLLVAVSVFTIGVGLRQLFGNQQRVVAESQPAASEEIRSIAPGFTLMTLEGDRLGLKDLRGKVVLLNFWATWCPPCKAEMADLDALHQEYADSQGFAVVGVNMQEEDEVVAAFADAYKISFPLLLDTDGRVASTLFSIRSLPTSMIIDREGLIRDAWLGQISKEAMLARLQRVW